MTEPPASKDVDADAIVDTVLGLDPLSELPRTGWLLRGIRPCESVADHSHGVSLVALLLTDAMRARGEVVDGERVLRMAIVHDAPEARLGDVPMPVKDAALDEALGRVEATLARQLLTSTLADAWDELEAGQTVEARLVRAADKVHMMIKALAYERAGRGRLDEFWERPETFRDRGLPIVREVFEVLCRRAGRRVPSPRA
jgi:putative hydrolase of HD superfamily